MTTRERASGALVLLIGLGALLGAGVGLRLGLDLAGRRAWT